MTTFIPLYKIGAEQVARIVHETTERLAPDYGYEERDLVAWEDVPEKSKQLAIAVFQELIDIFDSPTPVRHITIHGVQNIDSEQIGVAVRKEMAALFRRVAP